MTAWIVLGLAVTVVVVGVLIRAAATSMSEAEQVERELRLAPRATALGLADGASGRLAGVVTSDATLRAPLTGRPCVAYVVRVDEKRADRRWSRWRERLHEVRGVPFTIDDGTGRALIDPSRSTLLLHMDSTTRSGRFDSATPVEESFLARHQFASTGWFLDKTLRDREGVIEAGERVAIVGRGLRQPDPDAAADPHGAPGMLPTRVVIAGTAQQPVLVTDREDLIDGSAP
jgi:CBS domain-containing protein